MKTQQIGSKIKPSDENDVLAFIAKCPKCKTQRAFKANDTIMEVVNRESSGYELNTYCEKCSKRFAIQLCWTKRWLPGWIVEKIILGDSAQVEDPFGMSPEKGVKVI